MLVIDFQKVAFVPKFSYLLDLNWANENNWDVDPEEENFNYREWNGGCKPTLFYHINFHSLYTYKFGAY